ncbi:MAG: T9SS type A sorting domain-containing protein [Flavobacteriales bacterium]|nr:T9SS type A sorting domain-containing protein [Flavobacteriales bacterium]
MYQALVTNGCTSTSTSISVSVGCPDIIQPTTATTSTTIQCGGSYNYYDSGGSGSSYSANENGLITICPSSAGQYVSVTVVSFNIENNFDYLYVFDGNDGSADIIGVYTGTIAAGAVITASSANSSGCLSFRFVSDGLTQNTGWNLTVTCTGSPAAPYPTSVEDCTGGVVVCGDGALNGGTTGYGYQELPSEWNSCLNFGGNGEIQSNWYIFSPSTSGTIGFLISPSPAADYDWTLWGPYNSLQCPAFTNDLPLRCSAASLATSGPGGETGLAAPAIDVVEGSGGDGYLQPLTVIAGEIYILMLDNWDGNSNPFTISWQLSNGATLDCSPVLPINLLSFDAKCDKNHTLLTWSTGSEVNNDYFIVEKSGPNFNFEEIAKIYGSGNSQTTNNYSFTDTEINNETSYYRLMQVDFDGSVEYHRIIASNCHDYSFDVVNTNLTYNNLDLVITSGTNEYLTISLYSSVGKLITQQIKEINVGNNSISLRNFNISTGIYLISIQGKHNNYSQKLISK